MRLDPFSPDALAARNSVPCLAGAWRVIGTSYRHAWMRELWLEGLRRAGLPELPE